MSDTTLQLGSFQFAGLEIPADISGLGVAQQMHIHRLVGGDRIIDSMGQDFHPLEWSGLFFGTSALSRLSQLKALCATGQPQKLTWHSFAYTVLIRDVSADERRQFEIPYHIACEVVSDDASPIAAATPQSIDESVQNAMSAAQIQVQLIDDENLTAQMSLLEAAISAVDTLSELESSALWSILQPLTIMRNITATLMDSADEIIDETPGFAGLVVGEDALSLAVSLDSTEAAMFQELELLELNGILGVLYANLNAANGSPNTIATAGGNLFAIAAERYGDAQLWTSIAAANGRTDPFIDGAVVLTLPLSPKASGGILSA